MGQMELPNDLSFGRPGCLGEHDEGDGNVVKCRRSDREHMKNFVESEGVGPWVRTVEGKHDSTDGVQESPDK